MKIAFDSGPLKGGDAVRGMGMMTKHLLIELESVARKERNIKIKALDAFKADLSNYDLVHFTNFKPYFLSLPGKKLTKTVITIPDLIPLIFPKQYPPGVKGKVRLKENIRRLRNVDGVITISETSKKDIVRFLGIPSEKIHVIYLAAKKVFKLFTPPRGGKADHPTSSRLQVANQPLISAKTKFLLPTSFVLYVGDVNYNKNIPTLVNACKLAKIPLVICGKNAAEVEIFTDDLKLIKGPRDWVRYLFGRVHPEITHYKELARLFEEKDIIRTGFLTDEELAAMYNLASVYVQPSYYEGFGLVVLEAMASGTPVVISKTQALVEIAGNAALIADPNDPKDLASKIKHATRPKTSELLTKKGFKRAKDFSWERCAQETLDVYKKVTSEKS